MVAPVEGTQQEMLTGLSLLRWLIFDLLWIVFFSCLCTSLSFLLLRVFFNPPASLWPQRVLQGEGKGQGAGRLPETQRKTAAGGGPKGRLQTPLSAPLAPHKLDQGPVFYLPCACQMSWIKGVKKLNALCVKMFKTKNLSPWKNAMTHALKMLRKSNNFQHKCWYEHKELVHF